MRKLIVLFTIALLAFVYIAQSDNITIKMSPYIDTGYYYPYTVSDAIVANTAAYSDTIEVVGANWVVAEIHLTAVADTMFAVLLASNDSTHFANLNATGDSLAMTAVGNYALVFNNASIFRYYVIRFFEISDGASATWQFRVGGAVNAF